MKLSTRFVLAIAVSLATLASPIYAADALDPAVQAKVDAQIKIIQGWAADPIIVKAVKEQNAKLSDEYKAMTQEKWQDLGKTDPFVRSFDKNPAGEFLKSKKTDLIIRAFLSDAAGLKVAFTAKTLSWSHKDDAKHKTPMEGKTWQGPMETDKASGLQQIQIAVPVLDGGKPIGSLIAGLSATKL